MAVDNSFLRIFLGGPWMTVKRIICGCQPCNLHIQLSALRLLSLLFFPSKQCLSIVLNLQGFSLKCLALKQMMETVISSSLVNFLGVLK